MPSKIILFAGILLLITGVTVRKVSPFPSAGLFMILLGVALKTYYIVGAIRSGMYRPGAEMWLLFVGLSLFLGGLYLRNKGFFIDPIYLIVTGLVLKILFVVRFIQLVRQSRRA
jgi:hypothetical protein